MDGSSRQAVVLPHLNEEDEVGRSSVAIIPTVARIPNRASRKAGPGPRFYRVRLAQCEMDDPLAAAPRAPAANHVTPG